MIGPIVTIGVLPLNVWDTLSRLLSEKLNVRLHAHFLIYLLKISRQWGLARFVTLSGDRALR